MNVPNAGRYLHSYQVPKSGAGYVQLGVYNNLNFIAESTGNSEYIEAQLLEPMQKGQQYYLEFYVSPDFYAGYTDAIGMALSDTFYFETLTAMEALSLNPVIENWGTLITDTIGWTRIAGCHTAKGGEAYTIIGNFRTTDETLLEFDDPTYPFVNFFYIEDVLIMPFDPLPDTLLLCEGISEELNAQFLDATYLWNTGQTDAVITAFDSGEYSVEAFMPNCTLRDTVVVLNTTERLHFPSDTIICEDEPLHLSAPLPGVYQWSEGSRESEIFISSTGNYALSITNQCGEFVFSTNVEAEDCMCNVYIPNVFSPNGDGVNDFLEIHFGCDFEYHLRKFSIFDRWGGHVYSVTDGTNVRWDGNFREKPLRNGVYVWFLEYDVIRNGTSKRKLKKGDITILK